MTGRSGRKKYGHLKLLNELDGLIGLKEGRELLQGSSPANLLLLFELASRRRLSEFSSRTGNN